MLISILAVGEKMPRWVNEGFAEYNKRLSQEIKVKLVEIPAVKRSKSNSADVVLRQECERIQNTIPDGNHVIALERTGKNLSTLELADKCKSWLSQGRNVTFLIGGPEGLAQPCLEKADELISLSNMTFPHPIARLVVIEQLYRAYTILHNHPYHK